MALDLTQLLIARRIKAMRLIAVYKNPQVKLKNGIIVPAERTVPTSAIPLPDYSIRQWKRPSLHDAIKLTEHAADSRDEILAL